MSVLLDTSAGPIAIELYWQHAPNTCKNFWELARTGYYDGVVFHRVIKEFMIQGMYVCVMVMEGMNWCVCVCNQTTTNNAQVVIRVDLEGVANPFMVKHLLMR